MVFRPIIKRTSSLRLTEEFGSGFSERNLRSFRLFYRTYQERSPQIWQKRSANLPSVMISQKPPGKLPAVRIRQTASGKSPAAIAQKPSAQLSSTTPSPFTLSWSHYVLLLSIKNPEERSFYEIEATQSGWSLPELKRQLNSGLYERLALSRNKKQVRLLAEKVTHT